MPYAIYSRITRLRPKVLATAMTALLIAPVFTSSADVKAGIDAARHGNFKMAHAEFLREAARQGLAEAQINLGIRDWRGTEALEDRILAYAWTRKAAGQGDIGAVQTLEEFERSMSEEDVQAGKNLSLTLNLPVQSASSTSV